MKGYERDKICIDYPIKKRRNITMKWGLNTLLSTGVTIWRPTPFGTLLLPAINSCWKWGYSEVAEQMEGPVCTMLIRLWQVNRVEVAVPTWAVGSSADWWISGDGADKGFELNMFLNISFCFHPFPHFLHFSDTTSIRRLTKLAVRSHFAGANSSVSSKEMISVTGKAAKVCASSMIFQVWDMTCGSQNDWSLKNGWYGLWMIVRIDSKNDRPLVCHWKCLIMVNGLISHMYIVYTEN